MLSIVVPTYNEENNISKLFSALKKHLKNELFEVIFVDDGSSDDSLSRIKQLAKKHSEVKYISFSRNFGHQAALRAGLDRAKGEAVISMDADLQHPPELLGEMLARWHAGYEIVYTRRDDKSSQGVSTFKKSSSATFYRLMNKISDVKIDPGAADFRLLDRKVVDVINSFPEPNLFLRGFVSWVGFKSIAIDYIPAQRFSGESKYSLKKMLSLALNGITQFSVKPLRIAIILGVTMSFLAVIYTLYALFDFFFGSNNVSGWTSLIIVVLMTSGLHMILLGVVGEYIGKTFIQTKNRPDYIIRETDII